MCTPFITHHQVCTVSIQPCFYYFTSFKIQITAVTYVLGLCRLLFCYAVGTEDALAWPPEKSRNCISLLYTLQIIRVRNDGISLDDQRHTPALLSPRNARRNVLRHDGVCATSQLCGRDATTVTHVWRQSNVLSCTTDNTVSQPPITLLIHVHCHQNLHFNLDMRHKLTLG